MLWLLLLLVGLVLYLNALGAFNNNNLVEHRKIHEQANALDLLDERYARGELSTDEYDAMKKI